MQIRKYVALLLTWWWLLILVPGLIGGAVFYHVDRQPAAYRATATIFVNQVATAGTVTYTDTLLDQALVVTYTQMITQPIVLDLVRTSLALPYNSTQLAGMIAVTPVRSTQLIDITATASTPGQSRDIANTVAQVFIDEQQPYLPPGQATSAIRVVQPALLPTQPVSSHAKLFGIGAGIVGLIALFALLGYVEDLNRTVKTPEELEESASLSVLGTVGHAPFRLGSFGDGQSPDPSLEACRLIRANIEFAARDTPIKTLLVTSALAREGKSSIARDLGIVLSQAGKRVILVDADLRAPDLHHLFNVPGEPGLAELIDSEDVKLDRYLRPTTIAGLRVLPAGQSPVNPSELLGTPRLDVVLDLLRGQADAIVLDSAPVLGLADSIILASRVDGTVLVVDSERTRPETIRQASDALTKSGTRLIGAVLNNFNRRANGNYRYRAKQAGRILPG